jgi:hypothetical protein
VPRYVLLLLPSANRVYAGAAARLAAAELEVLGASALGGRLGEVAETEIGGVPYVAFAADGLDERDAALLSTLSAIYALFQVEGPLLRPVSLRPPDRFDDDLVTIQRYPGKTNEQFTRLLLNLTLLASSHAGETPGGRLSVLDPLCGRGTTLNQALRYGFDAGGIELDARDFDAYALFIRTWLRQKRLKHRLEAGPVRRDHRVIARRLHLELGESRDRWKAGESLTLTMVNADTCRGLELFPPASFDLVVTDLPYGVQHGSRTAERALSRRPLDLLAAALPVWTALLRPGGAVGLAWNTRVARREQVAALLAQQGLLVLDSDAHRRFEHRVDQAIVRDLLVARKA